MEKKYFADDDDFQRNHFGKGRGGRYPTKTPGRAPRDKNICFLSSMTKNCIEKVIIGTANTEESIIYGKCNILGKVINIFPKISPFLFLVYSKGNNYSLF